jgi:hypothetical protein
VAILHLVATRLLVAIRRREAILRQVVIHRSKVVIRHSKVVIHHSKVVILLLRQVIILQLRADTPLQLAVILLLVDIRQHRAPILRREAIPLLQAAISNLKVILRPALASRRPPHLIQLLNLVPCLLKLW